MQHSMISNRLYSLSLVAAVALVPATAPAALYVYDPFGYDGGPGDYLLGDEDAGINVIGTQNPTTAPDPTFYSGGWIQAGGDSQAVQVGSLHYPLFPSAGGHAGDAVQFSCCSFGRSGRAIAGGLGGDGVSRTIYQSFLIDFGDQGTDEPDDFGYRAVEWFNGAISFDDLAVRLYVNAFTDEDEFTLEVDTPSGVTSALLNGGGLTLENMSGVHLIVMKFEFNAVDDDIVTVYLDPTDSIESNWTPAASIAVNASDLVITHHSLSTNFVYSGGDHRPARFDELRWGDTFADVTPFVPEPTSLASLLIGVVGLGNVRMVGRRRWRGVS